MHESRLRWATRRSRDFEPRLFLLDALALTLILITPFVVLLKYHGYGYLTPEVVLLAAMTLAAAVALAVLVAFTGSRVRTLVLALLLTAFIDVQSGTRPLPSIAVTIAFVAVAAGFGAILWLLREHVTKILSVVFVTLITLTLLMTTQSRSHAITNETGPAGSHAGNGPLLIHLIFDEHIGVEGLPPEVAGARQLRSDLVDFYTGHGFRLFGRAYSQYANTHNSIANLVNLSATEVNHPYLSRGVDSEWDLHRAAYFDELQHRGYQLHVYQSTYMNVCDVAGARPQKCTTYPIASIAAVQNLQLPAWQKARFIVKGLLTQSRLLRVLNKVYDRGVQPAFARVGWTLPAWRWEPPSFGPLPVPVVFEQLTADVLANPRGHAFFAHLMLPHYPYVFDSRCALVPNSVNWLVNRVSDSLVYNTSDSREQRYGRYFDQLRCSLTLLDGLMDALDSRGLLQDATIIVHGDHGSRIPAHFPTITALEEGVLSERDYVDTFSTLYAIKAPGVSPAYVEHPASLVQLLSHHLSGEPLSAERSCKVFLTAGDARRELQAVAPKFCTREIVARFAGEEP